MNEALRDDSAKLPSPKRHSDRCFPNVQVASLIGNLPELILAHLLSDKRVAIIIETGRNRYVQFLATEDRKLILECVSNRFLAEEEELGTEEELTLIEAGFELPGEDREPHPNWWWRTEDPTEVMVACRMAALVIRRVFRLRPRDLALITERTLPVEPWQPD